MKAIKKITTLGFVLITSLTYAQDFKPCSTDDMVKQYFKEHPEAEEAAKLAKAESEAFRAGFRSGNQVATQPFVIPIVFHIIHQYGSENISDAQIRDAVEGMNEDFQLRNADTSLIVAAFKNLKGNAQFELRLATKDPNGNCTNGIDRIYSNETNIGDDGSKLNVWPRNKYLNVWVVKAISSGAAGYSMYPSSVVNYPQGDGVMILSTYVGSIGTGSVGTSRALTHEVGHWSDLEHTWGSTNQPGVSCGDDGVSDTPITKGFTSCNTNTANQCNVNIYENIQNIMDYAYCQRMFTIEQCTRMQAAMSSSISSRNNLGTQANLIATGTDDATFFGTPVSCSPKADFNITPVTICAGGTVSFKDLSFNNSAVTRNWSFSGGSPATSTDSLETVTYPTAGVYSVSLTVSNSAGTNTKTQTALVTVLSNTATYSGTNYIEGFEGSLIPNTDWTISSTDAIKWQQVTTAKHSGASCVKINNFSAAAGEVDNLISNTYDLSTITNPFITFWVSYAQAASTNNDRLRVLVSTNCGQSWSQRYSKAGSTLKTVTNPVTSSFLPTTASQWRMESVSLASVATSNNIRIKFEFEGDDGNNIYLDDINIGAINAGLEANLEAVIDFNVMPNPFNETSILAFNLPSHEIVNITVYDVLGKEVKSVLNNEKLASGSYRYELNKKDIGASGIYFVRVNVGGASMMKKIVLN